MKYRSIWVKPRAPLPEKSSSRKFSSCSSIFDVGLGCWKENRGKTSFEIHYVSFIAKLALTKVELFIVEGLPVLPFTSETQQRRDVIFVSIVFIF